MQVVDEQRASFHRFLLFCGITVCLGVALSVGYLIYNQFASRNEPPKLNQYVPVPVQVGDKTVLIGVGVAEWQVPPELNSVYLQLEQLKRQAEEKAARDAAKEAAKDASRKAAPSESSTNRGPGAPARP